MSLISGPGRGGIASDVLPDEVKLVIEKHVEYIQSLDKVSHPFYAVVQCKAHH